MKKLSDVLYADPVTSEIKQRPYWNHEDEQPEADSSVYKKIFAHLGEPIPVTEFAAEVEAAGEGFDVMRWAKVLRGEG